MKLRLKLRSIMFTRKPCGESAILDGKLTDSFWIILTTPLFFFHYLYMLKYDCFCYFKS